MWNTPTSKKLSFWGKFSREHGKPLESTLKSPGILGRKRIWPQPALPSLDHQGLVALICLWSLDCPKILFLILFAFPKHLIYPSWDYIHHPSPYKSLIKKPSMRSWCTNSIGWRRSRVLSWNLWQFQQIGVQKTAAYEDFSFVTIPINPWALDRESVLVPFLVPKVPL